MRGDRAPLSSRLLFTCSTVGEGGTYPGSTVVKELFENTRPPEDCAGDTVLTLVGVDDRPETKVGGSVSGDGGKFWRIRRYPCWINPKNRASRVYTLSRTSPKVAGINDDISPGSALEHSMVQVSAESIREEGGVHTFGFSLGIEPNLIDGIAISHAVVKHRFINDYMVGGQLLKGGPFFMIFGFVRFCSGYNLLRIEEPIEVPFPIPCKDFIIDHLVQVP